MSLLDEFDPKIKIATTIIEYGSGAFSAKIGYQPVFELQNPLMRHFFIALIGFVVLVPSSIRFHDESGSLCSRRLQ